MTLDRAHVFRHPDEHKHKESAMHKILHPGRHHDQASKSQPQAHAQEHVSEPTPEQEMVTPEEARAYEREHGADHAAAPGAATAVDTTADGKKHKEHGGTFSKFSNYLKQEQQRERDDNIWGGHGGPGTN